MKRIPKLYNSEVKSVEFTLSSRVDKLGNMLYVVEYTNLSCAPSFKDYVAFAHFSSALDFIQTNFR